MILLLLLVLIPGAFNQFFGAIKSSLGSSESIWKPCDNYKITMIYNEYLKKYENQYSLIIEIPANTATMLLTFFSEATIELVEREDYANITNVSVRKLAQLSNTYGLIFSGISHDFELCLQVIGPVSGPVPYIESLLLDYNETCITPKTGFLDSRIGYVDESCGRRKVVHTQLIVHGQSTKSGDWPWHVAILRIEKSSRQYICGGTLISSTLVLTAAHCASLRGNAVVPDILNVHLGKHYLIGGDVGSQEREVFRVILHPEFDGLTLNNDIALLKLKSEAVFSDYVQPACLWNEQTKDKLPQKSIFGTVVGWGFNQEDAISSTLQKITIPIVSELTCLKSNPTFFHKQLNDNKFCAGFANGTSVCNGDSGGGLVVFVPDSKWDSDSTSGGWYVRGIVSVAPRRADAAICDPYEYTLFTDVDKYLNWLLKYL